MPYATTAIHTTPKTLFPLTCFRQVFKLVTPDTPRWLAAAAIIAVQLSLSVPAASRAARFTRLSLNKLEPGKGLGPGAAAAISVSPPGGRGRGEGGRREEDGGKGAGVGGARRVGAGRLRGPGCKCWLSKCGRRDGAGRGPGLWLWLWPGVIGAGRLLAVPLIPLPLNKR